MTRKEIEKWAFEHINSGMKRRIDWENETGYKMTFENGDTYEYNEHGERYTKKTVTIAINGRTANTTDYIYKDFAWIPAI